MFTRRSSSSSGGGRRGSSTNGDPNLNALRTSLTQVTCGGSNKSTLQIGIGSTSVLGLGSVLFSAVLSPELSSWIIRAQYESSRAVDERCEQHNKILSDGERLRKLISKNLRVSLFHTTANFKHSAHDFSFLALLVVPERKNYDTWKADRK